MKRMLPPPHEQWHPVRDQSGMWKVVDGLGKDPPRTPDPLARLTAVHLAAAAPTLQSALAWLVQDMHSVEINLGHIRHRVRLNYAEVALIESKPPLSDWLRLNTVRQQDLDLAA